ncbi:Chloramphenicol acetyltransferase 3 [Virgibacillus salexigens]|uniref:Chloramphenicol acetyltransferase 3 n=1 Tax=Virgibacillus massiliensis TaxID=1462526 RepID=A0A024QHZ2_9BACI|nr:CatA-like O-acetyltransferase [Virgibacillus massiliensis]CDQ41556.1 Chloramphenicol acetyltransferase 3 [Virgibacillus massiliensis]
MGVVPPNVVNISSIPWMHFEHFSSQSGANKNNLTPLITSGKYEKVGSQLQMPVNIKIHHATVDAYHVTLFFKILQRFVVSVLISSYSWHITTSYVFLHYKKTPH